MTPTRSFASALAEHPEIDASTLALMVGVDDDVVGEWVAADSVPPDFLEAVSGHLGIDVATTNGSSIHLSGDAINGSANGAGAKGTSKRRKPTRKRSSSRRRGSMTKTAVEAATTCARLSVMEPERQTILTTLLDIELADGDRVETLVALTEKVLSPPKTLASAIEGVAKVREEDNPTRAGMALATMDKAELREIHRMICACTGVIPQDLPSNNIDAAMVVLDAVSAIDGKAEDNFAWVTELFG